MKKILVGLAWGVIALVGLFLALGIILAATGKVSAAPARTVTAKPSPAPTVVITEKAEPLPAVTVTATPAPAPTVTATVSNPACLKALEYADQINIFSYRAMALFASHFESEAKYFAGEISLGTYTVNLLDTNEAVEQMVGPLGEAGDSFSEYSVECRKG